MSGVDPLQALLVGIYLGAWLSHSVFLCTSWRGAPVTAVVVGAFWPLFMIVHLMRELR